MDSHHSKPCIQRCVHEWQRHSSSLPAVMLSPKAITTLMSCGFSSYTLLAERANGGSGGQLNSTDIDACSFVFSSPWTVLLQSTTNSSRIKQDAITALVQKLSSETQKAKVYTCICAWLGWHARVWASPTLDNNHSHNSSYSTSNHI